MVAVAALTAAAASPIAGAEREAKPAALAYVANNARFTDFQCKFTFTAGFAATPADWDAKKYDEQPEKADCVWAVSGPNESIRIVETPETVKMRANPKLLPVPGMPNLMIGSAHTFRTGETLIGSKFGLQVAPCSNTAWVYAENIKPTRPIMLFDRFGEFSLRGDGWEIGRTITDVDAGRVRLRAESVHEDGRGLVKLTATGAAETLTYWLDPARGHTPVRRTAEFTAEPATVHRSEYSDYRKCPDDRWFAGRVVDLFRQRSMTRWQVREVRVTELDADAPPPREAFIATVPAGIFVADSEDVIHHKFTARRQEKIHIDDLPTVYQMTQELPGKPLADTAIPPTPSRWRWAWWGGGAAVALAAVRFVVRRRRE